MSREEGERRSQFLFGSPMRLIQRRALQWVSLHAFLAARFLYRAGAETTQYLSLCFPLFFWVYTAGFGFLLGDMFFLRCLSPNLGSQHQLRIKPPVACLQPHRARKQGSCSAESQELSGDPNPQYFLKSIAVQMRGVLQYTWEVYCWVSLLQSLEARKAQRYRWGGTAVEKWRCTRTCASDSHTRQNYEQKSAQNMTQKCFKTRQTRQFWGHMFVHILPCMGGGGFKTNPQYCSTV